MYACPLRNAIRAAQTADLLYISRGWYGQRRPRRHKQAPCYTTQAKRLFVSDLAVTMNLARGCHYAVHLGLRGRLTRLQKFAVQLLPLRHILVVKKGMWHGGQCLKWTISCSRPSLRIRNSSIYWCAGFRPNAMVLVHWLPEIVA